MIDYNKIKGYSDGIIRAKEKIETLQNALADSAVCWIDAKFMRPRKGKTGVIGGPDSAIYDYEEVTALQLTSRHGDIDKLTLAIKEALDAEIENRKANVQLLEKRLQEELCQTKQESE